MTNQDRKELKFLIKTFFKAISIFAIVFAVMYFVVSVLKATILKY